MSNPNTPHDEHDSHEHRRANQVGSIGSLLHSLGELADRLSQASEQGMHERSGTTTSNDNPGFSYHVSFRTGSAIPPAGSIPRGPQPGGERPGGERPAAPPRTRAETREPLVDIFDEGEELLIVAELPGISMSDIRIDVREDILTLTTSGRHAYAKEILLPTPVDTTTLQQTYRNGILDVRLRKVAEDHPPEPR